MSKITDVREEFVTALDTAITEKVHGPFPSKVEAPAVVVMPDNPYITGGSTYGSIVVRLTVEMFVLKSAGLDTLDDLILTVLETAVNTGWAYTQADELGYPADRPDLMTVSIHIGKEI